MLHMRYEALGKFKDHLSFVRRKPLSPETPCGSLSNLRVPARVNNVESGSILAKNSGISHGSAWTRRLRFLLRLCLQYKSVKNKQVWVIRILKSKIITSQKVDLVDFNGKAPLTAHSWNISGDYNQVSCQLLLFWTKAQVYKESLSFCRGSRVEGSMSRARVPCRGSRVTFFSNFFFWKR